MDHPSSRNIRFFLGPVAPSQRILLIGALLFMMTSCATGSKMEGVWEIQEEDKSYMATLDEQGNGTYTWKNGTMKTTEFIDRRWKGTWQQTGNDREGGFEVLLSEDEAQAEGVWWYTRMGDHDNIPPRKFGGDYLWIRQAPKSTADSDK